MRPDYFEMISRITSEEAGKITTEADVPQQSTILEGHFPGHPLLPGVLMIEAMAQTRLVAASDVGGQREIVVDGQNGFLFASDSIDALAAGVTRALALCSRCKT